MPSHAGVVEINGASLYYETTGTGPPLVMLHGHLLDHHQWDDQFATFANSYQVVRYDARGFGQSALPPTPFSHTADLYGLLQFLNLEHAYLMGCSGGGAICIDFTLQHPTMAKGLILVGTSVNGYQPSGPIPPRLLAMREALQHGEVDQAVELSLQIFTDGPRRKPQQVNTTARERMREMTTHLLTRPQVPEAVPQSLEPPALSRLAEIQTPTLAIVGGEDDQMLHDIATLLTAQIVGAQMVVIPDAGHHPNMEHPQVFNQIVRSFLGQISET